MKIEFPGGVGSTPGVLRPFDNVVPNDLHLCILKDAEQQARVCFGRESETVKGGVVGSCHLGQDVVLLLKYRIGIGGCLFGFVVEEGGIHRRIGIGDSR